MVLFSLTPTKSELVAANSDGQSTTSPPVQQDQDTPLRLSSRLIQVPVSASDASGKPVKDLKAEDIVIEEAVKNRGESIHRRFSRREGTIRLTNRQHRKPPSIVHGQQ